MRILAIVSAIVVGLFLLDRLGLWLESRGWLYYRKKRGSVSLSTAVLETQALLDPSKRYVLEASRSEADESESGGPPKAGH